MSEHHDPRALIQHAVDAEDWQLVELIARVLGGRTQVRSPGARRAYLTLIRQLGLV